MKIQKYFCKGLAALQIGLRKEAFAIKKIKSNVPWTYVISDVSGENIVGTFYEKKRP